MKIIEDKVYLEVAELESYGIPKVTIYNGISFNNRGKTKNWEHIKVLDHKSILILYDKIPVTSSKKLPTKTQLLQSFLNEKAKENELLEAAKNLQTV